MSAELEKNLLLLTEEFGMLFEVSGVPRMAGRILGWLMLCDPPQQSAAQLAQRLGASRGSISTMTRLLETYGLVDRFTMPGERLTYYRVRQNPWLEMLGAKMRVLTAFRQVAEKGLDLLDDAPPAVRDRLTVMRDTYHFFENEFPLLIERLKQERAQQETASNKHEP